MTRRECACRRHRGRAMITAMSLILHYAPDNASLIVRLALEELGLPYQTRLVSRAARAQEGAAYRALNPHGLIPVLEAPAGPIFETAAILLWLDGRTPGALAPTPEAPERGNHLKWLIFLASTLHPALRMTFYPEKYCPDSTEGLRIQMRGEINRHLGLVDAAVTGPFFAGTAPGAVDIYLAPLLRWCALYPRGQTAWFNLDRFERLARLALAFEARPSALRAAEAEGLGPTPFSAPHPPDPPEGSAT